MQIISRLWLLPLALAMSACSHSALLKTKWENREAEHRVADKTTELQTLETQNQYLLQERTRLATDMNRQSMTLNELKTRLAQLQAENAKTKAVSQSDKKNKARMQQLVDQYSRQLSLVDNDKALNIGEKQKKIEDLKHKIRKYLLE